MRKMFVFAALVYSTSVCADDITRISMIDLAAQTHKWDGKTIETAAYCFYADVNEFRCSAPGGARVDFTDLSPEPLRKRIENVCDTISKMLTRSCYVKLRFVYDHFDTVNSDSGTTIHVVVAKDDKGELLAK